MVFRFGGGVLCIVCPSTGLADAVMLAERIVRAGPGYGVARGGVKNRSRISSSPRFSSTSFNRSLGRLRG